MSTGKQGILLVNMGGPSDIAGVKPFLTAILEDPFILGMPAFVRIPLSRLIVAIRLGKVIERYRLIGGGSPLKKWSERLIESLSKLNDQTQPELRLAYAFRYCSPTIPEILREWKSAGVDHVTLLPLFPHYTRAMTGSITLLTQKTCSAFGIGLSELPQWGADPEILALQREYLDEAVKKAGKGARVLFVAHGVPISDIRSGDTYDKQVEWSAAMLGGSLPEGVSWSLAYSSRVGPVKWLQPYLEAELGRLGESPEPLVIMQLSFVFDCLETLYDLDIVASETARSYGINQVVRVPSYNDDPRFAKFISRLMTGSSHG